MAKTIKRTTVKPAVKSSAPKFGSPAWNAKYGIGKSSVGRKVGKGTK